MVFVRKENVDKTKTYLEKQGYNMNGETGIKVLSFESLELAQYINYALSPYFADIASRSKMKQIEQIDTIFKKEPPPYKQGDW